MIKSFECTIKFCTILGLAIAGVFVKNPYLEIVQLVIFLSVYLEQMPKLVKIDKPKAPLYIPDNNKTIMINMNKCNKCGYEWVARTENPRECPECKSRDWDKNKGVKR